MWEIELDLVAVQDEIGCAVCVVENDSIPVGGSALVWLNAAVENDFFWGEDRE